MTPEELRALLTQVAVRAAREGELPDEAEAGPPVGYLFAPADARASGVIPDWVSPVAIRWAPALDRGARELATVLAAGLMVRRRIGAVEVDPSGMLAITLSDHARSAIITTVLDHAETYALPAGTRLTPVPLEVPGARPTDDPVAVAQRAHARLCRVIRNAEAVGVLVRPQDRLEQLHHVPERRLLVALADLPARLDRHAGDRTQQLRAVTDLASLADAWTFPVRPLVVGEDIRSLHGARLALATATRVVLRNGLARLGLPAPERM